MRKLIQQYFSSLDGVVQAPGGAEEDTDGGFEHGGWSIPYFDLDTMGPFVDASLDESTALLFGRKTWEGMAAAWPDRDDGSDPFASRMNSAEKYVVSSTLGDDDMTWANSYLLATGDGSDAVGLVSELKARGDGDLLMMGSSELGRALLAADLVDEMRLMIEPVVLGGGKTAFPVDGSVHHFELTESTVAETGVICCVYRAAEAPAGPVDAPTTPTPADGSE